MKKIDCFILAAGESSRMFPLSTIMEKSLLPVNGVPVIRHIVENLTVPEVARHIRRIIICCLTKFKKQFEHEFRDMPDIEIKEFEKPKGTYSTWWQSVDKYTSEYCMVHYADCLTEIDYTDFIKAGFKTFGNKYKNGLIAVTNNVKHDYSEVIPDPDDEEYPSDYPDVMEFREKPKVSSTWSGIGIFRTKAMEKILNGYKNKDFAFDAFPVMINHNTLKSYRYNGYWYDVGNLNSYRKVCELFNNE